MECRAGGSFYLTEFKWINGTRNEVLALSQSCACRTVTHNEQDAIVEAAVYYGEVSLAFFSRCRFSY